MAIFLVESYAPRTTSPDVLAGEAREAAAEMAGRGTDVRYVRTIFVPEDETCFHLFDAPTADDVARALASIGVSYDRITRAEDCGGDLR